MNIQPAAIGEMTVRVQVARWGNSLGVRIPKDLRRPPPSGSTTLVPKGRTRDVTGQTMASPLARQNATGETTSAGRSDTPERSPTTFWPTCGPSWRH
jgi:hypothetical protein